MGVLSKLHDQVQHRRCGRNLARGIAPGIGKYGQEPQRGVVSAEDYYAPLVLDLLPAVTRGDAPG
jgi:hypothetical protein